MMHHSVSHHAGLYLISKQKDINKKTKKKLEQNYQSALFGGLQITKLKLKKHEPRELCVISQLTRLKAKGKLSVLCKIKKMP